jgi:hypothetical protein
MSIAVIGLLTAALGYVVAIVGTWRHFRGAPEQHLSGLARIGTDAWVTSEEKERFDKWKAATRWTQPAIIVGSSLQLLGTVLMGIAAFGN